MLTCIVVNADTPFSTMALVRGLALAEIGFSESDPSTGSGSDVIVLGDARADPLQEGPV